MQFSWLLLFISEQIFSYAELRRFPVRLVGWREPTLLTDHWLQARGVTTRHAGQCEADAVSFIDWSVVRTDVMEGLPSRCFRYVVCTGPGTSHWWEYYSLANCRHSTLWGNNPKWWPRYFRSVQVMWRVSGSMGYDVLVTPSINGCGCRPTDRCVEAYPLPQGTVWCTASFCGNVSVIQFGVAIGPVAYVSVAYVLKSLS